MTDFQTNPSASQISGTRFMIEKSKNVDDMTINWILGSQSQDASGKNFEETVEDVPMGFAFTYGTGQSSDGALIDVQWLFDSNKNGTNGDWNQFTVGGETKTYEAVTLDKVVSGHSNEFYSAGNVESAQIFCDDGDCYIMFLPRQYDCLFDAAFRKDNSLLTCESDPSKFEKFFIYYYVVPGFDISKTFNTNNGQTVEAESVKDWLFIKDKLASHIDVALLNAKFIEIDLPSNFIDNDKDKDDTLFPIPTDRVRIGDMKLHNNNLFLAFGYEDFTSPTELWYMGDIEVNDQVLSLNTDTAAQALKINPDKLFGNDENQIESYRIESFDILPNFSTDKEYQFVLGFDSDFDYKEDKRPNKNKKMYHFVKIDNPTAPDDETPPGDFGKSISVTTIFMMLFVLLM